MSTLDVSLTDHDKRVVGEVIASGKYRNASEVVSEALRLLERREATEAEKLARFHALIDEGEAAYARGDYIELEDNEIAGWLASLGRTGRGAPTP